MPAIRHLIQITLLCLCALTATLTAAQARELRPTPAGGGPGITSFSADEASTGGNNSMPGWHEAWEDKAMQDFLTFQLSEKSEGSSDIGGYDDPVDQFDDIRHSSLAITSTGVIYLATEYFSSAYGFGIRVYRSDDNGNSFTLWGEKKTVSSSQNFQAPSILVAEGTVDRIFMVYSSDISGSRTINMLASPLLLSSAAFDPEVIIMDDVGVEYSEPHIASDVAAFDLYYLYVVAEGQPDTDGTGVHFARSTDYGSSFESSYAIASLTSTDRGYFNPQVAWGFGGYVHVAWDFSVDGTIDDDAIRYRRCPSYGGGGLASWEATMALTERNSGTWESKPLLAVSTQSNEVMIAYSRKEWVNNSYFTSRTAGSLISRNLGAIWETEVLASGNMFHPMSLIYKSTTDQFLLGGDVFHQAGLERASSQGAVNWSAPELFADKSYSSGYLYAFEFALDESQNQQACTVWPLSNPSTSPDELFFDAEWRADPGYPNYAPGFPMALPAKPMSDPVVVDLDGDGDLEILFTDLDTNIQAYHHDGTPVAGWPVSIGGSTPNGLYHSPVAVGDLNGDGQMTVVAGNKNGLVFAFDPTGQLVTGFPYDLNDDVNVFVSIGAIGGFAPRTIVVVGGNKLRYVNHRGELADTAWGWNFPDQSIIYPAAIGDIDGDGVSEVVVASLSRIYVKRLNSSSWTAIVPNGVAQMPSLADFDNDGDVEVVVPGPYGVVYFYDDNGNNWPGFPITVPTGAHVSSIALAQNLATYEPELIFTTDGEKIESYFSTGVSTPWFPQPIGAFTRHTPIVDNITTGIASEIILGAETQQIHAWSNFGSTITGWPRDVEDWIVRGAASGDLDQDGLLELVFLSESQMMIFDVNSIPNSGTSSWPMYGHNPQRTGCLDCVEDVTTAVRPEDLEGALTTRMSFAAPSPNPTNGPALFSFNLPVRAAVQLDVYDLRGSRVRSIFREEMAAGSHSVQWNGCDEDGQTVASGTYFATLKVRGPGLARQESRKVNVLR